MHRFRTFEKVKPSLNFIRGYFRLHAFGDALELRPLEPVRGIYLGNGKEDTSMIELLKTWLELKTDRRAVTMLEYGLIAALIAAVCVGAVTTLGTDISTKFNAIATSI
jgi:pilus assembly protein Flp/PilA